MAEYLPVFKPGQAMTSQASATITAGMLLEVSGSGTVGPAGAASVKVVGVAATDAASGDKVTYFAGGVQHCPASGAITAGARVDAVAAGVVAGTTAPVGVALTTAADTADVRVLFNR
jgi:predicted RecA/RadA family phage recombinase